MFTLFTLLAQAQPGRLNNPIAPNLSPSATNGTTLFNHVIQSAVSLLFLAGVLIFVLFFFIGAFKWILSSGDKGALQNAREAVLHAIIGLAIMFILFAVLKLVEAFLGICLLTMSVPGLNDSLGASKSCSSAGLYSNPSDRDQYYKDPTPLPSGVSRDQYYKDGSPTPGGFPGKFQ